MTSRRERLVGILSASRLLPFLAAHPRWNGVLVLNYHRIGDPSQSPVDRGVFSATAEGFEAHLTLLKRDADIVRPGDLAARIGKPGRHVMITFDDGYRDNFDLAFPILRSHGVAATFFLCTGFLDRRETAWWDEIAWLVRTSPLSVLPANSWLATPLPLGASDREPMIRTLLSVYKSLPASDAAALLNDLRKRSGSPPPDPALAADLWMTWDMVREMAAAGMEIGGHTVSHPVLSRLAPDAQRAEIEGGQERFLAELGRVSRSFAYPVGSRDAFDGHTKAAVRAAGFDVAFSFYGGYARMKTWDPLDIPRVHLSSDTSLTAIRALIAVPQLVASPPGRARKR